MIKKPTPILFTPAGYAWLKTKIDALLVKRERVLVELQRAREQGDLSENGAYKAARFELGDTDRAIRQTQHLIKYGVAAEPRTDGVIGIGSRVKLVREDGVEFNYILVGTYEADPMQGKISMESPMGKTLTGCSQGQTVVVASHSYYVSYSVSEMPKSL